MYISFAIFYAYQLLCDKIVFLVMNLYNIKKYICGKKIFGS